MIDPQHMSDHAKIAVDVVSVSTVVAALAGWLPPIAAIFSIIWLSIQIYDRLKYGPRRKS